MKLIFTCSSNKRISPGISECSFTLYVNLKENLGKFFPQSHMSQKHDPLLTNFKETDVFVSNKLTFKKYSTL